MSRHDHTPPMKRVFPLPPSKRVIPTNHPAYRNYEASLLAKAEQDITAPRPVCKTTLADVLALILAMFILMVLAACAFLVIMWGLS